MKKHFHIVVLFCLFALCAHAETIILRTGARVRGTIVFQNEEVVIVRDEEGARFQYMRADVEQILTNDKEVEAQEDAALTEEIKSAKKVSILLEVAGGAAVQPHELTGGTVSADLLVGSHHIKDTHLFVGAGLGYHGLFLGGEKYNFLPIRVAVRMPLMEAKHAPVFGIDAGYGVALSKNYLGGLYAGVDFGYRCQVNPKTAVGVVAFANFQQAKVNVTETIEGVDFVHTTGRYLVCSGVKLALYF